MDKKSGFIIVLVCFVILIGIVANFTNDTDEALIRENERCLYENARLKDANTRLLEELSETVEDWEEE